jgi:hypothetical protein
LARHQAGAGFRAGRDEVRGEIARADILGEGAGHVPGDRFF